MRRDKRPRKARDRSPVNNNDDNQFTNNEAQQSYSLRTTATNGGKKQKEGKSCKIKDILIDNDNADEDPKRNLENEDMEKSVGFCCYICHCPEEKRMLVDPDDPFLFLDESLRHRRCCHDAIEYVDPDWRTDFEIAADNVEAADDMNCDMNNSRCQDGENDVDDDRKPPAVQSSLSSRDVTIIELSELDLQDIDSTARRMESKLYNGDALPDPFEVPQTNEKYADNRIDFASIQSRSKAVVLDLFAGIGSAIVVLKRLGIAMQRIVHVEHDPVATHVYKWNHDSNYRYNKTLPEDGIEQIYFEKFERVEELVNSDPQRFVNDYGPFDIVVGGAPCIDYSLVNANRKGVHGDQGSYMPRFGKLIQQLQRFQPNHHIFFLSENAIIRNDKELNLEHGDLEIVKKSFGIDWSVDVDAGCFSPCNRNRTYLSNIPSNSLPTDVVHDEEIDSATYLSDNFILWSHLNDPNVVVKVNTFMASFGRIDKHPTMSVAKRIKYVDGITSVECRPYNVMEREKIMGFPIGYVEDALHDLFQNLNEAYSCLSLHQKYWKDEIPEIYHPFGGRPVSFGTSTADDPEPIYVKLCPPMGPNHSKQYYNERQYGKRLIGNAFSIPVVEILLRNLQTKFSKDVYAGYNYEFVWQTNNKIPNVAIKEEEEYDYLL